MRTLFNLKFFASVLGILFVGFLLFATLKIQVLLNLAQSRIESTFHTNYPEYQLECDTIATNFFSSIYLSGIRITDLNSPQRSSFLTIDTVTIHFSFSKAIHSLLKKENVLPSLVDIKIIKPVLNCVEKNSTWRFPQRHSAGGFSLIPIKIILEKGSLQLKKEDGKELKLENIQGSIDLKSDAPKMEISGKSPNHGDLKILSHLNSGALETQISLIKGNFNSWIPIPGNWDIRLTLQNPWPLHKNGVLTSSLTLRSQDSKLEGSGKIDFSSTPKIDYRVQGNLDLESLASSVPYLSTPTGKAHGALECSGDFKNLTLKGSLKSLEAQLEGEPLQADAQFYYAPSQLKLNSQINIGKSWIKITLNKTKNKNSWTVASKNLSLSKLLKNKNLKAEGALTTTLTGSRNGEIAFFSGPIEVSNASFKNHKLGNLRGSVKSNSQYLVLNVQNESQTNTMNLALRHEKDLTLIEKGTVLILDKDIYSLVGTLDRKAQKIEGILTLEGALNGSLGFWHQFNSRKEIESHIQLKNFKIKNSSLNGNFYLKGEGLLSPKLKFSANVTSEDFSWNQFFPGKLKSHLEYDNQTLTIQSLTWGNISAHAAIVWEESGPALRGHWSTYKRTFKDWCSQFKLKDPPLLGDVTLSGDVEGPLNNLNVSLDGALENVRIQSKNSAGEEIFKGKLNADLSEGFLKSIRLNLSSSQGAQIKSRGEANLKTGAIDLENSFVKWDVEVLQNLLGWKGFKGEVDGFLKIQGDWNSPKAKGKIIGKEGTLGNIPLENWEISGTFQQKELHFSGAKLIGRKGSWRFTVLEESWLRILGDKSVEYRLATDFANIPLGEIFLVGSGVAKGEWKKDPETHSVTIHSEIKTNDCLINELELKPSQFALEFQKGVLKFLPSTQPMDTAEDSTPTQIKGEVHLNHLPCLVIKNLELWEENKRVLLINGEICKDKPSFQMIGEGVDASVLTSLIKSPIPITGKMNLNVTGQTHLKHSEIMGDLKVAQGQVGAVPFDSLNSKFKWSEGILYLPEFEAKNKDLFLLNLTGNLPLKLWDKESFNKKIDLTLNVPDGNLSFLNYLESDLIKNAKGNFKLNGTLKGTSIKPQLDGNLTIHDGEFDSRYLTQKGENLEVELLFNSSRLTFKKAKFNSGKSKIVLGGGMDVSLEDGEIHFDNFDFKLQTVGKKGIPLQVPEFPLSREKLALPSSASRGTPTFYLHLTGNRETPHMEGWVELEKTLFSYPPIKKPKKDHSLLEDMEWDFVIRTGDQTTFQNEYVYANVDGKIHIKGRHENFSVNGKINSDEGTISLYGAKFQLKSAELEIYQPPEITLGKENSGVPPTKNSVALSFKAEQTSFIPAPDGTDKVQDTITLSLERTPLTEKFDSKKLTFRSSQHPTLSSERVAMNAGLGINLEEQDPVKKDMQLRQGIARLLDSQLASPLARNLIQRTGFIDRIEINQETEISRSKELRGSERTLLDPFLGHSIVLEKTFGAKLGIGYRATLDKIKDRADFIHQLELRYPFYKGIWLYGSTELDSKENLGRDPERRGGIKTQIRFDPSDLFKKKESKEEKKEQTK